MGIKIMVDDGQFFIQGSSTAQFSALVNTGRFKYDSYTRKKRTGEIEKGKALIAHLGAVDPDLTSGKHVMHPPIASVAAGEDGMDTAHTRTLHTDIRALCAADDILPVVDREGLPADTDIGPDFRLIALAEHGADAADKDDQRQEDQRKF